MGVQIFPVLEGYDRDYFLIKTLKLVDWKSLPSMIEELDAVAEELKVEPLSAFHIITRDESPFDEDVIEELEGQGELIDGIWYLQDEMLWSIEPRWFPPSRGLVTVNALLRYLQSDRDDQDEVGDDQDWELEDEHSSQGTIFELEQMKEILIEAQQKSRQFRLSSSV